MKLFNKTENSIILVFMAIIFMIFTCGIIDSYLSYLNKKQIIDLIKLKYSEFSVEQIQGLVNSRQ